MPGCGDHPGQLLRGPEAPPPRDRTPLSTRSETSPPERPRQHPARAGEAAQPGEAEGGGGGGSAAPGPTAPGEGALGAGVPGQGEPAGGAGKQAGGEGEAVPPGGREAEAGEGRAGRATGGVPAEPGAAQGGPEERGEGARAPGEPTKASRDLEAQPAEEPAHCDSSHGHTSRWSAGRGDDHN